MDKRKIPRVICDSIAEISFKNTLIKTRLENLSIMGMYARSSAEIDFEYGSIIDIIIHSGPKILNQPIRAKGIIHRSDNEGFAARFIKMSPLDFEELKWVVSNNKSGNIH